MGSGIPPNKRQRLSPNPPSPAPYQSPFAIPNAPTYPPSPYTTSPQTPGYNSLPTSPAAMHPPPFHQPQPYQHPNAPQPAPQSSMPPPKLPYSKTGDSSELEKANARDLDVNNISDVLTGSGIDLRAEEDNLLHNYRSFNSQATGSTASANNSFNNWGQQSGHGAYQGTGALSQEMTEEQQQAEFIRKHEQAARILNESAQQPLNDPFLSASVLRHRIAKRGYDHGISINVDGLFDKIPDKGQQEIKRTTRAGSDGEQIIGLEAASLLNQNAPLVEILTLISLAAEERVRTVVEDAFALCQGRQNTSHGLIPPQLVDIAVVERDAQEKMAPPVNILKTPWEAPDSAVSPTTTASKGLPNAARLPTPPSEAPPTPQRTYQNPNRVVTALVKRVASGASTPRPTATAAPSGTTTPTVQAPDKALMGRKRKFGEAIERTDTGAGIQLRDLIHVLDNDGREKKTLHVLLARMKNTDKDSRPDASSKQKSHSPAVGVPGRV
ncbi:DUF605 multi-domain protein [Pyrenophora tritici-repentis]|nr:DUF605 multi-domain protein [Pyrenophora tritici-repentis]